jgi:hypothetical protein
VTEAENKKWTRPHIATTRGQDWASASISQTVHFDGANLYVNLGTSEIWMFPGQAYYVRQDGQLRAAGADVAAQALDQAKNGWLTGLDRASVTCAPGTWQNRAAVNCTYQRQGTFRGTNTFNRLIIHIDPASQLPLAAENVFNPLDSPGTTGSGTTTYRYVQPPPIVTPQ